MSYTPGMLADIDDAVVFPAGFSSMGLRITALGLGLSATVAWPTANLAIYIPFFLERSRTVYQVGWVNGATPTGTREVGIYSASGTKIISGAAVASGASLSQLVNVTDTILEAGVYWLAATNTDLTAWFAWAPPAPQAASLGILTQVTANPLPATATMALNQTLAFIPNAFASMRAVI